MWNTVRRVFDELVDLSPAERERRLSRSALPEAVIQEVGALLAAADASGDFLETPAAMPSTEAGRPTLADYSSLPAGAEIGAFRIVQLIGRGGQGEVYRAERADGQFDQVVALKLLRPEAVRHFERFRIERQILAGLEHPGIARLIDGGAAPDGRPYLAMEYVEGRLITAFSNESELDLRPRLNLFREACAAVAYAHRNLIVHRDLKPGNILVTDEGCVKLLDFGVARILDDTREVAMTEAFLTPDYAAPEQFEGRRATTATDAYALGAILFELLTGRTPWGRGGIIPGASRLLRDEPPRASRSAASFDGWPVSPAAIAGDLDAIIAKAMRKEPDERYESVTALSDDVGRHLAHLPVLARAGDRVYRFRRFVRRNRGRLAAGAVTSSVAVIGAVAFALQARRTGVERTVSREESARGSAVRDTLMLMLRTAGEEGGGAFGAAKQMLDSAAARLSREARSPDGSQPALLRTLGELYAEMDDYAAAAPLFVRYAALAEHAGDAVGLAEARQSLAAIEIRQGRLDLAERSLRAAQRFWSTNPTRFGRQRAEAAAVEAGLLRERGRSDEALARLRTALAQTVTLLGAVSSEAVTLQHNIGVHLIESGRFAEADEVLQQAWRILVEQGRTHSTISIGVTNHRAGLAFRNGRVSVAIAMWREAIDLRRSLYGPSAALAALQSNLARILIGQEQQQEALTILDEAVPMAAVFAGDASPVTIILRQSRALALGLVERPAEARTEIENALASSKQAFGRDHVYQAFGLSARSQLHLFAGDVPASRRDFEAARAILIGRGDAAALHLAELEGLRALIDQIDPESDAAQAVPESSR